MGLADIGTQIFRARVQKAAGFAPVPDLHSRAEPPPPTVGFTNPVAITEELRAVDHAVDSLQADWARDVPQGSPERSAFESWRTTIWKPFQADHRGMNRLKSGLVFGTDDLMAQVQTRRAEFEGFGARYQAQTQKQPTTPIPVDPRGAPKPPPSASPSWWPTWAPTPTLSVPWWVWVGGTLAVIAGGYGAYRWYKVTRETEARYREDVFRVLPTVLGASGGGGVVAAHDVASCPSCVHGGGV